MSEKLTKLRDLIKTACKKKSGLSDLQKQAFQEALALANELIDESAATITTETLPLEMVKETTEFIEDATEASVSVRFEIKQHPANDNWCEVYRVTETEDGTGHEFLAEFAFEADARLFVRSKKTAESPSLGSDDERVGKLRQDIKELVLFLLPWTSSEIEESEEIVDQIAVKVNSLWSIARHLGVTPTTEFPSSASIQSSMRDELKEEIIKAIDLNRPFAPAHERTEYENGASDRCDHLIKMVNESWGYWTKGVQSPTLSGRAVGLRRMQEIRNHINDTDRIKMKAERQILSELKDATESPSEIGSTVSVDREKLKTLQFQVRHLASIADEFASSLDDEGLSEVKDIRAVAKDAQTNVFQLMTENVSEKTNIDAAETLKEKLRAELRTMSPHITERQLDTIVNLRVDALLAPQIDVSKVLKPVDMGDDPDLSLNYRFTNEERIRELEIRNANLREVVERGLLAEEGLRDLERAVAKNLHASFVDYKEFKQAFNESWEHQRGSLMLKDENEGKEWKRTVAEHFVDWAWGWFIDTGLVKKDKKS